MQRRQPHIPEPVHRVPPEPVGSGMSFWRLPVASLKQVQKICQHYEKKTGGLYDGHSKAARYVYDMSHEIQDVIAGLLADEGNQATRIRYLERLVTEWEAVFGHPYDWQGRYGLARGQILTPKLLDQKFRDLRRHVERLEHDLGEARTAMAGEADAERQAMDETLFREHIRLERRIAVLEQEHETEIERLKHEHEQSEADLRAGCLIACRNAAEGAGASPADSSEAYWKTQFTRADRARGDAEARCRLLEERLTLETGGVETGMDELRRTNGRLRAKITYLLEQLVALGL